MPNNNNHKKKKKEGGIYITNIHGLQLCILYVQEILIGIPKGKLVSNTDEI